MSVTREQVLRYRFHVQQLDRTRSQPVSDVAILDLGVQDTGPHGASWAFANRGADSGRATDASTHLVLAWTLRDAPHFYRRSEVAAVAAATAPFSDSDAAKRIFDAARPLRAAGISPLDALDVVATEMRAIVTAPTVKGDMSARLTARLTARLSSPYLRHCRACNAIHTYEQPFRIAALRAGLELQPDTSPPVLQRIRCWKGPAPPVPDSLDVVRAYLHLLGPATPKMVAAYVDAPVKDVKEHWPDDVVKVSIDGETRWILADDLAALESTVVDASVVRLLSPFDLSCRPRTVSCWGPTLIGARSCGWSWVGRVRSSSVRRSSARGDPVRRGTT